MAWASCNNFFRRETAAERESALCNGPSWAAAILRCLAIDELPQLARRPVDRGGGCDRPGYAASQVLSRPARDFQFIVLNDHSPPAQDQRRPALVHMALVRRVADRVVHHRVVDLLLDRRVPDR